MWSAKPSACSSNRAVVLDGGHDLRREATHQRKQLLQVVAGQGGGQHPCRRRIDLLDDAAIGDLQQPHRTLIEELKQSLQLVLGAHRKRTARY